MNNLTFGPNCPRRVIKSFPNYIACKFVITIVAFKPAWYANYICMFYNSTINPILSKNAPWPQNAIAIPTVVNVTDTRPI